MNDKQWQSLMSTIIPKLFLDIEPKLQQYKMLGPLLWDLINQSLHMPEDSENPAAHLNLNFILRFLIRNLSRESALRDRSSLSLVSLLCQQPEAHKLRPRISAIDPTSLSECFKGDLSLVIESTAKFGVSRRACFHFKAEKNNLLLSIFQVATLTDTMQALQDADLMNARTHLIKLAIILEDNDLHPHFLENGGLPTLTEFLHKSLSVADNEPCLSVMSSIVKTLLFLAHVNPQVKNALASDDILIMNLLRYGIHYKQLVIIDLCRGIFLLGLQ